MQEIKCPNCGKTFVVDDSGYAQIAQQVRDSEFDRALRQRERDIAEAKEKEFELAQMRQKEAWRERQSIRTAGAGDSGKRWQRRRGFLRSVSSQETVRRICSFLLSLQRDRGKQSSRSRRSQNMDRR